MYGLKSPLLGIALIGMLALSGCISGDDDPAATPPADPQPQPAITGPALQELTGTSGNAASTPLLSITYGGTYEFPLAWPSNVTGWTLELTWDAADPASANLDLWIRAVGDYAIPPNDPMTVLNTQPALKTTGTSPLRMAFAVDELEAGTDYSILVRASTPAGVALDQSFVLNVATFDGLAWDADHQFA